MTDAAPAAADAGDPSAVPPWTLPSQQFAYPEGVQAAGMVAAPFLAGFSLSSLVLVLQGLSGPDQADRAFARPADLCTILLAAAAVVLIGAVQCAARARSYQVTPAQVFDWWGTTATAPTPAAINTIGDHLEKTVRWSGRAAAAYDVGVLLLLLAVPLLLIPNGEVTPGRAVSIAVGVLAFQAEMVWLIVTHGPDAIDRIRRR